MLYAPGHGLEDMEKNLFIHIFIQTLTEPPLRARHCSRCRGCQLILGPGYTPRTKSNVI